MKLPIRYMEMETFLNTYHNPVLLSESIDGLHINPEGIYVDATYGSGGHSRAILEKLGPNGRLIAFDQDKDVQPNLIADERFLFIHANFKYLAKFLKLNNIEKVNGILADLGVSSHQFDDPERGFSIRFDNELDMRMDKRKSLTAADIVSTYDLSGLVKIFSQYGEVPNAKRLAYVIVNNIPKEGITHSKQFMEIIEACMPKGKENKYLAQVYQALRMEVNQEMDALEQFLFQTTALLETKGRLVAIAYHSLEDRMVKRFMRSGNVEDKLEKDFYGNIITPFRLINRKAIVPTMEEITTNNRSRSAKLRIAEKK